MTKAFMARAFSLALMAEEVMGHYQLRELPAPLMKVPNVDGDWVEGFGFSWSRISNDREEMATRRIL